MAIFKYTLPSGANFELQAPTGTTQAQADFVFYSQVASGSLVGYTIGQSLSSLDSKLTKFGLSRLDRGTAGVDTLAILAIIDDTPVIASLPNLTNIALQSPITAADYIATGPVDPVGPLSPEETQAVVTQISNLVDQAPDVVTTDTGLGEYGLTPAALENAGYLKPGTSNYPDYSCVVGAPGQWTGKNGVYNLVDVLTDPGLQTKMQTEVMQNGYDSLTASGTITTTNTAPVSTSTGQVYTSTGALATVTAATLLAGTAAINGGLNNLITTSFAGANVSSLLSNPVSSISTLASGAVNSVTQSIANLPGSALNYANNLVSGTLNTLTGQASSLVNSALNSTVGQGLNVVNGLATSAASIANGVNGAIGGLIANASQFGAPVTALWAQGSGLLNSTLGSVSGLANNALGTVSGLASSAVGQLTGAVSGVIGGVTSQVSGLVSGALSSVTGQAQELLSSLGGNLDIFGKMGSFSIDFSLFSSDSLVSATKAAAGYSNTVNRQTVDAAVQRILGNAKIPTPKFEYPSLGSINLGADIKYAQQQLQNLTNSAVSSAGSALTSLTSGLSSTGIAGPV